MSNTDKLREIAFKWGCRTIPSHDFTDDKYEDKSKELLSDLTALISEGYYPKEFVMWLSYNSSHYVIKTQNRWWSNSQDKYMTLDELWHEQSHQILKYHQ